MSTQSTPTSNTASTAATETARADFAADRREHTVESAVREYIDRIRGGDLGALPAVLGLAVLCILFTILRPASFPTPLNFANLCVQAAPITILAMGLVFVLLLGEIDLSAGVTGGVCAAVLAKILLQTGLPWYVAVLAALAVGLVIGAFTGWLVAAVGIPSFVVTLAFFLAWQGITLRLIGQGGTVPVQSSVIIAIANRNLPVTAGWILCAACVLGYAGIQLAQWRQQRVRGLVRKPLALVVAQVGVVSVLLIAATYVLNLNRARSSLVVLRGIPYAVPLIAVLLILGSFVLNRTTYGRHVYAVGGNPEAARRAGINVTAIRISVFVIGATLAAVSGIVAASRLNSVTPDAGAGNTLLYAVGAAVIGGTSLFGGKGRITAALLGGLVIAVVDNGLGLLGYAAYLNYLVTGGVLLLAASVDALARKRRASTGG